MQARILQISASGAGRPAPGVSPIKESGLNGLRLENRRLNQAAR